MKPNRLFPKRPFLYGLIGFLLTFFILTSLLTIQYIQHYEADIFGKNLNEDIILRLIGHIMLDMAALSFPLSVMAMTVVYYRALFRLGHTSFKIKTTLLFSSTITVGFFFWLAFLAPINKTRLMGLLFDIQMKEVDGEFQRSDLSLFEDSPPCQNYNQLGKSIQELKTDQSQTDPQTIKKIQRLEFERTKMIGTSLLTLILFYAGMFLGRLNHQNRLLFVLFGIYLTLLPGIYFLALYFESLVKQTMLSPLMGQLFYLLIVVAITVGLFWMNRRRISK